MEKTKLSLKTLTRLSLYYNITCEYIENEKEYITSREVAKRLRIDDSQVRKDLKFINATGKTKVGFETSYLKKMLETNLNFHIKKDVFIIGAGNLGTALAKYGEFKHYGLNVLALFDNTPEKINHEIKDKKIFHISKLPEMAKKLNVNIAILTVPKIAAQDVANTLVDAGIKYIWNFSPVVLELPDEIKVWNENLAASFVTFSCQEIYRQE